MSAERLHPEGPTIEALYAVAGGRLPPDAAAWVEAHVVGCAECAAALRRLAATRVVLEPPAEGPFQRARDLAAVRRRLEARPPRGRRQPWVWVWAGGGALALATLVLAIGVVWRRNTPTPNTVAAADNVELVVSSRTGTAVGSRAGDSRTTPLSARDRFEVGSVLQVAEGGRLALSWGGARVVVEGSHGPARVRLVSSRIGARQLELVEGRVLLDVDPLPAGAQLAVLSGDAIVSVHGTVFLVERDSRGVSAAVDRGLVEVRFGSAAPILLPAGTQLLPGATGPSAIAPQTQEALRGIPAAVPVAPVADDTLDVFSDTGDAEVSVDGIPRGRTPLSLALPAGRHLVRVSSKGHEPVEERVDVVAGVPTLFRADLIAPLGEAGEADAPNLPKPHAERNEARPLGSVAQILKAARADMVDGRTGRAIEALEALRRRPLIATDQARVASALGQAERLALRPERAVEHLQEAARGDGPEAEHAQFLLAQTLGRDLGDARRAAAAWETAERRFPNGVFAPEVAYRLGEALLASGDTKQGIAQLERYLLQHPGGGHASEAHQAVGAARRDHLADCAGALPHFHAVAGDAGARGEAALVAEARCLVRLGRAAEARAAYHRYLSRAPDGAFADEARSR